MTSDRSGIRALVAAFATAGACVGVSYLHPAFAEYRPWVPGDPIPVLAALTPWEGPRVTEGLDGLRLDTSTAAPAVSAEGSPSEQAGDGLAATEAAAAGGGASALPSAAAGEGAIVVPGVPTEALPSAAGMPARPPGVATALVDADHRGMDPFYRALHRAANGAGIARAAHYGDSTIAADGITSQVRSRLQKRFGNGGPGYLSAGMDPRWNFRRDVTIDRAGDWKTISLLLGGGGGRYAYGGIVSTASPDGRLTITAPKGAGGKPTPMHRFELWLQGGADRGSWWTTLDGAPAGSGSAASGATVDLRHAVDKPEGYTRLAFGATGGDVPFYGVVMETQGPGVVWDALGVVGVGSRSFTQHSRKHLASQIAQRDPDLIVVMLGGNELGLPALGKGDGAGYIPYFTETVRRLRAGAPDAACLLITPVDQGTREGGTARTKPNLARLVAAQQKAAANEGCAFWNAWAAMSGPDAIVRWSAMKPPLAWTDLNHLSKAGQDIIGNLLADAVEHGYDGWMTAGGPSRPPPVSSVAAEPGISPPLDAPLGGASPAAAPPPVEPSDAPAPAPDPAAPAATPPPAPAPAPSDTPTPAGTP